MALRRGAVPKRPAILEARPLTPDDLRLLAQSRAPSKTIRALREKHHRIARLDAAGLPVHEILELTGIGYQTLYRFRMDPAYQELRSLYKGKVDDAHLRQVDDLAIDAISNMRRMEVMVGQHLDAAEESGELPPLKTLDSLISSRMDRFGYGKRTTNVNVNVGLGTELEAAWRRTGKAPPMLEATPSSRSPVASDTAPTPAPQGIPINRRGL